MTLTEVLPAVRQLTVPEKLTLIRLLAEELDGDEASFPLAHGKVYHLPTPYGSYGVAQTLAEALAAARETRD